ncbi:unnamed protein product [Arctogadus glacialis]
MLGIVLDVYDSSSLRRLLSLLFSLMVSHVFPLFVMPAVVKIMLLRYLFRSVRPCIASYLRSARWPAVASVQRDGFVCSWGLAWTLYSGAGPFGIGLTSKSARIREQAGLRSGFWGVVSVGGGHWYIVGGGGAPPWGACSSATNIQKDPHSCTLRGCRASAQPQPGASRELPASPGVRLHTHKLFKHSVHG